MRSTFPTSGRWTNNRDWECALVGVDLIVVCGSISLYSLLLFSVGFSLIHFNGIQTDDCDRCSNQLRLGAIWCHNCGLKVQQENSVPHITFAPQHTHSKPIVRTKRAKGAAALAGPPKRPPPAVPRISITHSGTNTRSRKGSVEANRRSSSCVDESEVDIHSKVSSTGSFEVESEKQMSLVHRPRHELRDKPLASPSSSPLEELPLHHPVHVTRAQSSPISPIATRPFHKPKTKRTSGTSPRALMKSYAATTMSPESSGAPCPPSPPPLPTPPAPEAPPTPPTPSCFSQTHKAPYSPPLPRRSVSTPSRSLMTASPRTPAHNPFWSPPSSWTPQAGPRSVKRYSPQTSTPGRRPGQFSPSPVGRRGKGAPGSTKDTPRRPAYFNFESVAPKQYPRPSPRAVARAAAIPATELSEIAHPPLSVLPCSSTSSVSSSSAEGATTPGSTKAFSRTRSVLLPPPPVTNANAPKEPIPSPAHEHQAWATSTTTALWHFDLESPVVIKKQNGVLRAQSAHLLGSPITHSKRAKGVAEASSVRQDDHPANRTYNKLGLEGESIDQFSARTMSVEPRTSAEARQTSNDDSFTSQHVMRVRSKSAGFAIPPRPAVTDIFDTLAFAREFLQHPGGSEDTTTQKYLASNIEGKTGMFNVAKRFIQKRLSSSTSHNSEPWDGSRARSSSRSSLDALCLECAPGMSSSHGEDALWWFGKFSSFSSLVLSEYASFASSSSSSSRDCWSALEALPLRTTLPHLLETLTTPPCLLPPSLSTTSLFNIIVLLFHPSILATPALLQALHRAYLGGDAVVKCHVLDLLLLWVLILGPQDLMPYLQSEGGGDQCFDFLSQFLRPLSLGSRYPRYRVSAAMLATLARRTTIYQVFASIHLESGR